jgi:hypothetical protein
MREKVSGRGGFPIQNLDGNPAPDGKGRFPSSDAGLQAAMASIKTDQDPDGLRNNFEAAATHLLPHDPVQRKRSDHAGGRRGSADISDVTHDEADISAFGAKEGIGKTGVHVRYHPLAEYQKLTNGQKDELREWWETTRGDKKRGKPYNKDGKQQRNVKFKLDKAIAAAVEKRVHEQIKAEVKVKAQGDEAEAYIMSIFQKMSGNKATVAAAVNLPPAVAPPLPPTLHGIIRSAKNAKSDWHVPVLQVASSTRSKRKRYHNVIQLGRPTWDPGGTQDPDTERKLYKITIPTQVYSLLATIMATDADLALNEEDMEAEQSKTELDSNANIPVVGRHYFIISDTGRVANVTPDYEPMELSIVNAAIQYDCPYDGQTYILVIRSALHVP